MRGVTLRVCLLSMLLLCLTIVSQEAFGAQRRVCSLAPAMSCRAEVRIRKRFLWCHCRRAPHRWKVGTDTLHCDGMVSRSPTTRLVEPRLFFGSEYRVVFQIQVPQALRLYKALHGRTPRDHIEFMDEIIRRNQISLPELPEPHHYMYDAARSELLVEGPAN